MIPILIICSSLLVITITFLKNKDKRPQLLFFGPNTDLIKFFELKNEIVASMVLQKCLLKAAVTLEKRVKELRKEKGIISILHRDRIISLEKYQTIKNQEEELEYERREIMAEAQEFREGWQDKIFEEAVSIANKSNKEDKTKDLKGTDDGLFFRKRDVLSKELTKRLEQKEASL